MMGRIKRGAILNSTTKGEYGGFIHLYLLDCFFFASSRFRNACYKISYYGGRIKKILNKPNANTHAQANLLDWIQDALIEGYER
jgi:hypothetical protein